MKQEETKLGPFDITDFNRILEAGESLFIEASAGTGKTYTIQQMVAKMVAAGTPLKKILIVMEQS